MKTSRKKRFRFARTIWRAIKILSITLIAITAIGISYVNIIRQERELPIPVAGATTKSWDSKSYWSSPWGKSLVHRGIDIFASQKIEVLSPISGLIISAGYSGNGGNYLYILGPKLRTYYFAHLNAQEMKSFTFVKKGQQIGRVGNSGNAIGSPCHLHFSIYSIFPIFRYYSSDEQLGWMKMFYLDPTNYFI